MLRNWARNLTIAIVAWSASVPATGCGDIFGPSDEAELARALRRWASEGPRSYDYVLQRGCGECLVDFARPVRIVVENRTVVSRTYVASNEPVRAEWDRSFPAIEGLFERIQDALRQEPAVFEARYHSRLGYPILVSIDYDERAVDDEVSLSVSDFRAR